MLCGAITAAAGLPPTWPERAPATTAPTPSSMPMIAAVCALASSARILLRWPPAMWPVSCASTPMIWFGVSARSRAPALMKMRLASITNALNERSLMMTTWLFCCARPAAPGGAQDRVGVVAQELLDLGVADDRQTLGHVLRARRQAAGHERARRRHRDRAGGSEHGPPLDRSCLHHHSE